MTSNSMSTQEYYQSNFTNQFHKEPEILKGRTNTIIMKYEPISCDFYDELEIIAMRQTVAKIDYKDKKGKETVIFKKIKTIQARAGEEFLVLEDNSEIRLDQLIAVDDKPLKNYC